ncbi:hypothetical protein D3C75_600760 [compost metagenome]
MAAARSVRRIAAIAVAAQPGPATALAQQHRRAPAAASADHPAGPATPASRASGMCAAGTGRHRRRRADLGTGSAGLSGKPCAADHCHRPVALHGRQRRSTQSPGSGQAQAPRLDPAPRRFAQCLDCLRRQRASGVARHRRSGVARYVHSGPEHRPDQQTGEKCQRGHRSGQAPARRRENARHPAVDHRWRRHLGTGRAGQATGRQCAASADIGGRQQRRRDHPRCQRPATHRQRRSPATRQLRSGRPQAACLNAGRPAGQPDPQR